jgi:cytosine permease
MSSLPSYVAAAKPVPTTNRAPWYKNVAPTYAGVMLWFMFWQFIVTCGGATKATGGVLSQGIWTALGGVVVAALICHFLFYLVPGLLGMKTGLPLYVVGTSTYGVTGGLFMPGFLMGLLQFAWLAVNATGVAALLCKCFGLPDTAPSLYHGLIATAFALLCGFVGLKGIHYLAKVATYFPLIPLAVLILLVVKTAGGLSTFQPSDISPLENAPAANAADKAGAATADDAKAPAPAAQPSADLSTWAIMALLSTYIVGFFATAGAAGTDIASNSRNASDVQWGGLFGITLTTILAGGLAILVVAGAYGAGMVPAGTAGNLNPLDLMSAVRGKGEMTTPIMQFKEVANVIMILLAISSFPGGCFSAFIAANSFKTTMPKVNPFISVGLGTLVAAGLAVWGVVGGENVIRVFQVIGASFGPVCGAMLADYLLAGRKWAGPRAGFNPAGWISWIVGFVVGAYNMTAGLLVDSNWVPSTWVHALSSTRDLIPVPPVAAFLVGFVLYLVLGGIGLTSRKLDMPAAAS